MIRNNSLEMAYDISNIFSLKSTKIDHSMKIYEGYIANLKDTYIWNYASKSTSYKYDGRVVHLVHLEADGTAAFAGRYYAGDD